MNCGLYSKTGKWDCLENLKTIQIQDMANLTWFKKNSFYNFYFNKSFEI